MSKSMACRKVAEHKEAFVLLMYVGFSITKNQPRILAKVFPKLHKFFTLNWLDDRISHRLTLRFPFCSEDSRIQSLSTWTIEEAKKEKTSSILIFLGILAFVRKKVFLVLLIVTGDLEGTSRPLPVSRVWNWPTFPEITGVHRMWNHPNCLLHSSTTVGGGHNYFLHPGTRWASSRVAY